MPPIPQKRNKAYIAARNEAIYQRWQTKQATLAQLAEIHGLGSAHIYNILKNMGADMRQTRNSRARAYYHQLDGGGHSWRAPGKQG